jgi:hypothetical protein
MVFEVFRSSGCLITCRNSKRQGENEHPEQLRSSQGFGEESKVTRFRSSHLKCHAPMFPSAALWQVPCYGINHRSGTIRVPWGCVVRCG